MKRFQDFLCMKLQCAINTAITSDTELETSAPRALVHARQAAWLAPKVASHREHLGIARFERSNSARPRPSSRQASPPRGARTPRLTFSSWRWATSILATPLGHSEREERVGQEQWMAQPRKWRGLPTRSRTHSGRSSFPWSAPSARLSAWPMFTPELCETSPISQAAVAWASFRRDGSAQRPK